MQELYLNLDLILTKLSKLEPIENDSYINVYTSLQSFTKRQSIKDQTTFIGLAHMVYGWMPTILTFDSGREMAPELFDKIEEGCLEADFLVELKQIVNHSIVGTSKVLHFLNGEDYAIWDSRVYRSITGKKAYEYRVNSVEVYIEYMNQMRKVAKELDREYVNQELVCKGYCTKDTSVLRMMELILFYSL